MVLSFVAGASIYLWIAALCATEQCKIKTAGGRNMPDTVHLL